MTKNTENASLYKILTWSFPIRYYPKEKGFFQRIYPEEKNEAISEEIAKDIAVINEELAQLTYDSTKMKSLSSITDRHHFEGGTMIDSYDTNFDSQKDEMRFDDEKQKLIIFS